MYFWKLHATQESSADLSSCEKNLIVPMLNWAIKIKSKEAGYTINYWIDYTNDRGKPNRGCHKPALKCFYLFYFSVKNGRWDTITGKCIYAYNLLNVTGMYLSESCEKSNGVSEEKIQRFCNCLIYLDHKTRSFSLLKCVCIYVCMYLFAIAKKSLKIAHFLILQSIEPK